MIVQEMPRSNSAWSRVVLTFGVLAAYSLWYCALFSPILFGGQLFPSDGQLAAFFSPVALWNPLPLAGMPGVAEPHLAQLYPLRWIFAAFPKEVGFNLFVVFSYSLASSLTFGYVFTVTRSALAASVGGLIFGTSGYMIAHLGHTGLFAAAAWLPLIMWSLEKLRRRFSAIWFVIAALSIAITIVAGHPQAFVYSIYLGFAYAICLGSTATIGWIRYVGMYLAIVGIGAAIAAAHILPMLELAELSVRSEMTFDAFKEYSLPLKQVSMLLFPYLFGGGFPPTFPLYFGRWNFSEITGYVGLLTLMLAMVGCIRSWKDRLAAFWIGAASISFLLALGDATPLLRITYYLPAINKLRAPARHFQEMTFALAVLAALGVQTLQKTEANRKLVMRVILLVGAMMAANLCLIVAFYGKLESIASIVLPHGKTLPKATMNPALWMPVAVFTLSVLALLYWLKDRRSSARSAILVAILAVDLGSFGWFAPWRYGTPTSFLKVPGYAEKYKEDLRERRQRIMAMAGWQESALAFSTTMSQLYAIPSVGGYGPLLLQRYAKLSMVTNGGWIDPSVLATANRVPDLLAARYIIIPQSDQSIADANGMAKVPEADLPIALGTGCGIHQSRQLRLAIPARLHVDQITIVSKMACSTTLTQGQPVINVVLIDSRGNSRAGTLRAGQDTAEWAIDCPDVYPITKHVRAPVFDTWDVKRSDAPPCKGHRFISEINVEPGSYKELLIDWLPGEPSIINISKLGLVDRKGHQTYWVSANDLALSDTARFEHVENLGTTFIYKNSRAMPRAWLVPEVITATADDILKTLHTSITPDGRVYDPYEIAFVEEPFQLHSSGETGLRTATIAALSNDRVEVATSAKDTTFLVLSDVYYPGWEASIDGEDTTVYRTNYALRGVAVPQGRHTVVFRFRPKMFYLGLLITVVTLIGLVVFLVHARRRR